MKERILLWFQAATERDTYFWLGLALAWVGLAGALSGWVATGSVGAILLGVAIFGVAPAKGGRH